MAKQITYETPGYIVLADKAKNFIKYRFARPVISFLLYHFRYRFKHSQFTTFQGEPLKNGISLYLPTKNEASFLMICLESLLGVADQFILIDNGSDDGTLDVLKEFESKYKNRKDILVLSRPDSLLVEIVQEAMYHVRYRYTLKWDGDMFAITEGKHSMLTVRKEALQSKRPKAFGLPRINFTGDIQHVSTRFPVIDAGEPFLRAFNCHVHFTEEFGRL